LAGAVFDMSLARQQHRNPHGLLGGKDMTLFHLRRLDQFNGCETLDESTAASFAQRQYLVRYLHEYRKSTLMLEASRSPPGTVNERADRELRSGKAMPVAGCSVFDFRTTKMPECILHLDRDGGILIACDALLRPS
jgi:hypothetical protein